MTRRQDGERGDGYQRHRNADGEPFGGERAALAAYKVERHKHAEDAEQIAADEPYKAAQGGGEDGFYMGGSLIIILRGICYWR